MTRRIAYLSSLCVLCVLCGESSANPPVASYLFPAGGRQGATVEVKAGGLFLHKECGFELVGPGVAADRTFKRVPTLFFEGPLLPLPDSQQAEDYPKDMLGKVRVAADAPLGPRRARLWTSEGAASGPVFIVGDLPEIVEQEIDGDPLPVDVTLPVTINGRIYPREDVDLWRFALRKGQSVTCAVDPRVVSPLEARLQALDAAGRVLAESDEAPRLRFTAPADGAYQVRIWDANLKGGPAYVYRLTITTGPYLDRVYPLGGRRGSTTRFELTGQGVPASEEVALPKDAPAEYAYRHKGDSGLSNAVPLDLDDLPEYVETDAEQTVTLPAVVNGRIGRPGAVGSWAFAGRKGEAVAVELRAARLGSPLQGVLSVVDATGKELARAESGAADAVLTFTPQADGTYRLKVRDRFRSRGGPTFAYRVRLGARPSPDFRLIVPVDAVTLPRGGNVKLRVSAERVGGFNGPVALAVEGLPPGVKASAVTLGPGQAQADLTLTADQTVAVGPARLTLRGGSTLDGRPATRDAGEVLVGVALPAPFKVVAGYDMRNAPRGTVLKRRYRIERNGFDGPLEVSLADRQARHLQGAHGPVLTIPPGVSDFEYPITLPPWMETGRTCRVCVMAVGVVKDGGVEHVVSFSAIGQNDQIIAVVETGRLGLEAGKTSLRATPGNVEVPLRVARGRGLEGPVRVEAVLPAHLHGVTAAAVTIPPGQERGTLTVRFAEGAGPFTMPLLLRATLDGASGPVIAETSVEVVPAGR
jgi:hypothetical protein